MILVTGATGFIGSHLLERLLEGRDPVRAIVRGAASGDRLRRAVSASSALQIVRADLVSGEGLDAALAGVDTVYHLAGVTKTLSIADYYSGNQHAAGNVARAVAASPRAVRMVHVSSLAAIGPAPGLTPLTEDAPPRPVSHYGKSKLEGERAVRAILPAAVILRPPAVYGPRDTDIFEILKSIDKGLVIQIAGGAGPRNERWFSAICVRDLVDGMLAAAASPRAAGRAYFLAHPKTESWSELIAVAARLMGRAPRTVTVPAAAAYAAGFAAELWARLTGKPGIVSRDKIAELQCPYWICDAGRAREDFGFTAPTGIEEGLARALAWYYDAGWLKPR